MEKRNAIALSVVIIVVAVVIILVLWMVFSHEDGSIPLFDGNGNGGTSIERTEWAFTITQISEMNDKDYFGESVIIGIVDSGIDLNHPDLDHINITAWTDLVNQRSSPYDDNGHGTHIAGIIAAKGEIQGIAPDVSMVVVKAIDADGSGSDSIVAEGIQFCIDNEADVICLSLGGKARFLNLGDETAAACNQAIDMGIFVVAAAGNDGEDDDGDVASPAVVEGVIAVGAIDKNKNIASFSSIGNNEGEIPGYQFWDLTEPEDPNKKPELVAPGVDITSTYLEKGYAKASGTSQAAAFVSGGLVLLLDANPDYQREELLGGDSDAIYQIKNHLMSTALTPSDYESPHDPHYGYGLIQIADTDELI
jgi:subtilisin family serine protease